MSNPLTYGSVCSGIEAATVAWHGLGWRPEFFSEIERFPSAVLAHHYPHVANLGDMTKFMEWPDAAIDVLVGGTPCQSFSVAGLRKGLDDPRGNLMLTYLAIARRFSPRWLVWENVPGVLSSNGGRDFGTFLGALGQLGYGFAYRVLDAQFTRTRNFPWAVPQRRRRVFVVAYLGDWRRAAAVLFDGESLSGNPAPRREQGERVAPTVSTGLRGIGDFELAGGIASTGDVAHCLNAGGMGRQDYETETMIAQPVAFGAQNSAAQGDGVSFGYCPTLDKSKTPAVAFGGHVARALTARHDSSPCADRGMDVRATGYAVRRLTPIECERLQGFPDDYTRIAYRGKGADACPDGPRYKALGNSMATNCMEWLGERIAHVEALAREVAA